MSGATKLSNWLDNGAQVFTKNVARSSWFADDQYYTGGNVAATPDWSLGWNTAQTVDALFLGLSAAQNTFVIAERADAAFDFAHGAQTNPTLFIHSAVQSTTQWMSLAHNQTNAVANWGTGVLSLAGGNVQIESGGSLTILGTGTGSVLRFGAGPEVYTSGGEILLFTESTNTRGIQFTLTAGGAQTIGSTTGNLVLNVAGTDEIVISSTAFSPNADGGISLGISGTGFSGLELSLGAAIGWNGADVTITQAANALTFAGMANFTLTQAATTGAPTNLLWTGAAHTALTASTENTDVNFNLARIVTFAAGALTTQRAGRFQMPTYTISGGASTIINAIGFEFGGVPQTGTTTTITQAVGVSAGGGTGAATNIIASAVTMVGIAPSFGAMTTLAGLEIGAGGAATISLGDQTATLSILNSLRLDQVTYVSTTLVRTVTNPATFYIEGAPIASTNVTFGTEALAMHVDAGTSRFDGHLDMQGTAPTTTLTGTTLNAGAGAGATIVVTAGSTDMHGRVTITAGNGTPTAGVAGQIVFNAAYNSAPSMVLFAPGDTDYWDVRPFVTSIGTTSYEITFKTAATTSQVIVLEYFVVQ